MPRHKLLLIGLIGTLSLASCGDEQKSTEESGEQPADSHLMVTEGTPTYPIGSKALITANHMEGMEGAEATIVEAFDTIAYIVSYTPTTGGDRATNYKWVIHEEIDLAPEMPIEPNSEVSLNADHLPGMEGAVAVIEELKETTVYMVDYTSKTGEEVKNYKWVIEEELEPIE